jgi:hypothetical protein
MNLPFSLASNLRIWLAKEISEVQQNNRVVGILNKGDNDGCGVFRGGGGWVGRDADQGFQVSSGRFKDVDVELKPVPKNRALKNSGLANGSRIRPIALIEVGNQALQVKGCFTVSRPARRRTSI